MKILIVGAGGREHALAWALAQSEGVAQVVVAPGNGGTEWAAGPGLASCERDSRNPEEIAPEFDLVVIGPEAPLVDGLADRLKVPVFGPSAQAARIEASKIFAKNLMLAKGVPTAAYLELGEGEEDKLSQFGTPVVVKDDGLAAGKGVGVFHQVSEALDFYRELLQSTDRVFVEEYLEGPELSVLAFCDGKDFELMPPARDHKRRFEGDQGPNTGGMGAVSPVAGISAEFLTQIKSQVFRPVLDALAEQGCPFVGVLYAGLKLTPQGPKVLEFNCRFGDPETQVLLPQFKGNLARLMLSCAQGCLDRSQVSWEQGVRLGVVLASEGYPGPYQKGKPIELPEPSPSALVFHAGTERQGEDLVTNGGRVLTVVGQGQDLQSAREAAYDALSKVSFEGAVFREDIGL